MGFWYYCQEKCCGRRVYAWEPSPSPHQYGGATGVHVPTYCLENDYSKDRRLFAPLHGRPHSIDKQSDGWVLLKDGYGIKNDGSLWKITDGRRAEFFDAGPWTWVSAKDGYGVGIKQDQTLWSWGSNSGFPLPGNGEVASWFIDRFPSLSSGVSNPYDETAYPYDETYPNGFVPRVTVDCSIESFGREREYYYSPHGLEVVQHGLECNGEEAELAPYIDGGSVFFIDPPTTDVFFTKAPAVEFTPPGAKATAILGEDGKVGFIRVDSGGSYSLAPVTKLLREDGAPVEVTSYIEGPASVSVDSGGSGYTNPSPFKARWYARCSRPASAGKVYRASLSSGGQNYFKAYAPQVSIEGYGAGAGAEATAAVDGNGSVISVSVTNGGAGYKEPAAPSILISGSGKDAAAIAFVDSQGRVSHVRVVNPGRGYGSGTTISFYPEGASATPVVEGGRVIGVEITNSGSGYFRAKPPTVTFTPSGATAVAKVGGGDFSVQSVAVTSPGQYKSPFPPTVSLTSGGGTDAAFKCSVNASGKVDSVWVTACGKGYSNPSSRYENDGKNYLSEKLDLVFTTAQGATGSGASGSAEVISTHRYILSEFYADFSYIGDITLAPGNLKYITLPHPIPVRESGFVGVTSPHNTNADGYRFAEGWRVSDCVGELTPPLHSPHATGGKYRHRLAYTRRIEFVIADRGSGYDKTATASLSGGLWGGFEASAVLGFAKNDSGSESAGATGVVGISVSAPIGAIKSVSPPAPDTKYIESSISPLLPWSYHKPSTATEAAEYITPDDWCIPSLTAYPADSPPPGGTASGAILSVSVSGAEGTSYASKIDVLAGGGGHSPSGEITVVGTHPSRLFVDTAAKAHYHCRRLPPVFSDPSHYNASGTGLYLNAVISARDSVDPHFEECTATPKPKCWYISGLEVWAGGEGYTDGDTVRWYLLDGLRESANAFGQASLSVQDGVVKSATITQQLFGYRNTGAIESVVVDHPGSYRSYYPQTKDTLLPSVHISAPPSDGPPQSIPPRQAFAFARWLDPAYEYEHNVNGTPCEPVLEATVPVIFPGGGIGVRYYYLFPHGGSAGAVHPYETIKESADFGYSKIGPNYYRPPQSGVVVSIATNEEIASGGGSYTYPFSVLPFDVGPEVVGVGDELVVEGVYFDSPSPVASVQHWITSPVTVSLSREYAGGTITTKNNGFITFDFSVKSAASGGSYIRFDAYVPVTTSPYVSDVYQNRATGSWRHPCKALHTSAFAVPDRDPPGGTATPASIKATLEDINGIAHVTGFEVAGGGIGYTYEPRIIYEASRYGYAGGGEPIRLLDYPTKISDDTGWTSVEFMGDGSIVAAIRGGNVYWWGVQGWLEGDADGKPPFVASPIRLGSSIEIRSSAASLRPQDVFDPRKVELSYPNGGLMPSSIFAFTDASLAAPHPHNYGPGQMEIRTGLSYGYLSSPSVLHHSPIVDQCGLTAAAVGPDGSAYLIRRTSGPVSHFNSGFCVLAGGGTAWSLTGDGESFGKNIATSIPTVVLHSAAGGAVEYRYRITLASGGSGSQPDSKAVITTTNYSLGYVKVGPDDETELQWLLKTNVSEPTFPGDGGRFFGPSGIVTSNSLPSVDVTGGGSASFIVSKLQDGDRFSSGWVRLGEPDVGGWSDIHPPLIGISSVGVRQDIRASRSTPAGVPCDRFVSLAPGFGNANVITAANGTGDIYATDAMSAWIENEIELKLTATGGGMTMPPRATIEQASKSISHVEAKINGRVVAFGVTRKGSGYSVPPTVSVSPPSAGGVAHICGPVEVKLTATGAGYRAAPKVLFRDPQKTFAETPGIPASASLGVSGKVDSITLTSSGSRYTSAPDVAISGDGNGATATAYIAGYVDEVVVTNGGSGYKSAPSVTIPGCKAVAVLRGGSVEKVVVTDPGSGFASPPPVTFEGGGPQSQAAATAVLNAGVSAVVLTSEGDGYTYQPSVGFSSGDAAAHCTVSLSAESVSVSSGGRYFDSPPPATVEADWCVSKLSLTAGGGGYQTAPDVLIVGGSGSGASASCRIHGPLSKATVVSGGVGYSSDYPPYVVVEGGLDPVVGVHAKASAVVAGGSIVAINIDTPGSGYSSPPTISLRYPEPATAVAEIEDGKVSRIKLINRGAFYVGVPEVLLAGGGATKDATATATVTDGSVGSITVTGAGEGYVLPPDVYIIYDRYGEGASVVSEINGVVDSIAIYSCGKGYFLPPKVLFIGGGGDGASATASATQEGGGASLSCKLNGRVEYIELAAHGNGYETPPSVSIAPPDLPNGTQAYAQARILGRVDSFDVISGGYGYAGGTVRVMVNGTGYSRDDYLSDGLVKETRQANKPYAARVRSAGGTVTGTAIVKPIQDFVTTPQVYVEDEVGVRPLATMSLVALGVDHLGESATSSSRPVLPYSSFHAAYVAPRGSVRGTTPSYNYVGGFIAAQTGFGTTQAIRPAFVDGFVLTSGGSGYVSPPTVSLPFGKAEAFVSGGSVSSVIVTDAGSFADFQADITSSPDDVWLQDNQLDLLRKATFSGGGAPGFSPSHASGYITIGYDDTRCRILRIVVTDPGEGYTSAPTVTVTPGPCVATAAISSGRVSSISITTNGYYSSAPAVTIAGGSPAREAKAEAVLGGEARVSASDYWNYQRPPFLDVSMSWRGPLAYTSHSLGEVWLSEFDEIVVHNETGSKASFTVPLIADTSGPPVIFVSGGSNYSTRYESGDKYLSIYGGVSLAHANEATAFATVSGGAVTGIGVTNGGKWRYKSEPLVYLSGGGGTGASATAIVESGVITSIRVDSPGSGYKTAPLVTIVDKYPYYESLDIDLPLPKQNNTVPRFGHTHPFVVGGRLAFVDVENAGVPVDAESIDMFAVFSGGRISGGHISGTSLHPFYEDVSVVGARIVHDMVGGRTAKALKHQHDQNKAPNVTFSFTAPATPETSQALPSASTTIVKWFPPVADGVAIRDVASES